MPRILLDLTPLVTISSLRGIGRYIRGLVQGLSELNGELAVTVEGLAARRDLKELYAVTDLAAYCDAATGAPTSNSGRKRNRLMARHGMALAQSRNAFIHLTEPNPIGSWRPATYSLTCHDLIPLMMHRRYLPRLPGWRRAYAAMERKRYERPRRILAVSHATKHDLCTELGTDPERVDVVWHGVDHSRFHARPTPDDAHHVGKLLGDGAPYVFYLGAGDPRKDLGTLVRAFARSRIRREARLVIAGHLGVKRTRELLSTSAKLGVSDRVVLTGFVPDELVPSLYRCARVHVFTSGYEGFGLPVLEAFACGTPTITSAGSSLEEVAGDAALVVPVGEQDALIVALESLFFDEAQRTELRAKGLARAQRFTWRACAQETVEFWRRATEGQSD